LRPKSVFWLDYFELFVSKFWFFRFWITLPKNNFTGNFWPKGHLTETPFDRTPFNRRPFDRKFILPKKVIWPKTKFIKRSFDQKYLENGHLTENLTWKDSQITEMIYDRKFIWPKAFFEKWPFDRKFIWPKAFSKKWSFDRKFICLNVFFRKMVIWQKKFLTKCKTTLIHH
jgi:hypothetical protein